MKSSMFEPEVVQELALKEGVCVRPLLNRVTDRQTGDTTVVVMPCRSTRETRCPSCANAARRLRIQQCAEGWHLEHEPTRPEQEPEDAPDELEEEYEVVDEEEVPERRVRSTRRRSDVADLPLKPSENRTIGAVFEGNLGRRYRPSMFVTLTLPSYGSIAMGRGVPTDPSSYDYRTAAFDALHFTKLLDRWIQNLRRCAGFKVQYFGAIEAQRRLAPHFHVALRGAIPRSILREVTRATYAQVWWPPCDEPVYVDRVPVWDGVDYLDPDTAIPLTTWEDAMAELDEDPGARPMHTLSFGRQVDIKGLLGGTPDADRSVRYLTKYLTKAVAETYTHAEVFDAAYEAHIDRLHDEVRYLPCTPSCANWLRFGIQPKQAGPGLQPGRCPSAAHDRENLGVGGRRVQVSRGWSGKTLSDHRADRAAVVKKVLEEAGYTAPEADRMSSETLATDGEPRYLWQTVHLPPQKASEAIIASVLERRRWRNEYDRAKAAQVSTGPPVENRSATDSEVESEA
ncbi:replication initiator [Intrasporangium sp. DVR]|uniref:replication initiator n=1 Tax=Intrasporangium sp. DVR TaxID=3127867 RepID=UPI00313A5869